MSKLLVVDVVSSSDEVTSFHELTPMTSILSFSNDNEFSIVRLVWVVSFKEVEGSTKNEITSSLLLIPYDICCVCGSLREI